MWHEGTSLKEKTPKETARLVSIYTILQKRLHLKRTDKTKERDFELQEVANCRKANI